MYVYKTLIYPVKRILLVLVLLWCGISILMESSENGSKMWKILKNSIFTMTFDVSMVTEYIKTNILRWIL